MELWAVFQAAGIAYEAFGDFKTFSKLFKGQHSLWGYTWGTPDAEIPELVKRAQRVALRRLRKDVLPDLPTKMWQEIIVEVDRNVLSQCDAFVKRAGGVERLIELVEQEKMDFTTMSSIRSALSQAKIPAMLEIVREHDESNEPLLVFSAHRAPIDLLGKIKGWGVITGDEDAAKKTATAERFQKGELKGLGLTIRAGGTALTLTRAARMLFVDRDWKPTANAQAEDRAVRLGQTRGVIVMILKANHPLDCRVSEILLKKQRLISASVDSMSSTEGAPLTEEEKTMQLQIALAQSEILEESKAGCAVRRKASSEEEQAALDGLQRLVFSSRVDERIALGLAEEAEHLGLSDAQWRLALKIAARGLEAKREETNDNSEHGKEQS